MRIVLAQIAHPRSFAEGVAAVLRDIARAGEAGGEIVCFPECCLKGMRGTHFPVEAISREEHDRALAQTCEAARVARIALILPTERPWREHWQNGAYVIDATGRVLGYQSKNQIPLEEEPFFVPGTTRQLFEVAGVKLGIVICHEGWRYPETVRWAAARGARIVFHPHFSGFPGGFPIPDDSYFEHAKLCRAGENHVWFASVNFALPVQDCATSVITPEGRALVSAPLNREQLVIAEVDADAATGYLARRYAPERYLESAE